MTYIIGNEYATLEEAVAAAVAEDIVVLPADYTLSADLTIPAGITVLIPTSGDYDDTTTGGYRISRAASGSAYVTLTIPQGVTLTVSGTLLAAGNVICWWKQQNVLSGNYGHVALEGELIVADGGALYARGVIDGSGTVTAQSGGTVYQPWQLFDWRGGTETSLMVLAKKTFPFNEYEISNIRAKAVYQYGSKLMVQSYVYASSEINYLDVEFLGPDSLLVIQDEASYCTSTYDHETRQLQVVYNGNVNINKLSPSVAGFTVNSSSFICPISKHIGITAAGGTLTIKYNCKMLPGSYLTVNEDAGLVVSSLRRLYVYDADAYQEGFTYCASAATEDAVLTINGTASGLIYSSDPNLGNIGGSAYTAAQGATYSITENRQDSRHFPLLSPLPVYKFAAGSWVRKLVYQMVNGVWKKVSTEWQAEDGNNSITFYRATLTARE